MYCRYPFIRICLAFVLGILINLKSNQKFLLSILLLTLILAILLEFNSAITKWKLRYWLGLTVHMQLLFLGITNINLSNIEPYSFSKNELFIVHLIQLENQGEVYNRYQTSVISLQKGKKKRPIKAYTYISTSIASISEGTILITDKTPTPIRNTANPGSFDFAGFAKTKGIQHTLYLNDPASFVNLGYKQARFRILLQKVKRWILYTLEKRIKDPIEKGLTEALLIGYKQDLDTSLQERYANTGVSHIIAISGMHLGLIFYLLELLIRNISGKQTTKYLSFVLVLPLLWLFSLLTGSSASVLRSVVVFTFLLAGNLLNKRRNSINSLLASGFVLLLINPNMVYDIGFQLSYAAVLSILIYEPLFSKWIFTKNKLLHYLWSMVAITLAAQVLTIPFVLFHFKQFPILFLFTNLVAVPISSIVLVLAIVLCFFEVCSLDPSLISKVIHLCLRGMNGYVEKIDKVPFNNMYLSFNLVMLWTTLATIAIVTTAFNSKKKSSAILFTGGILFISVCLGIQHYFHNRTRQILFLQLKNQTCIIHQHGKNAVMLASIELMEDQQKLKKLTLSLRNGLGIEKWQFFSLQNGSKWIEVKNFEPGSNLLLVSNMDIPLWEMKEIPEYMWKDALLIADGSNKLWKIRQWEKAAQELHLRLHSSPDEGPLVIPCKHIRKLTGTN